MTSYNFSLSDVITGYIAAFVAITIVFVLDYSSNQTMSFLDIITAMIGGLIGIMIAYIIDNRKN